MRPRSSQPCDMKKKEKVFGDQAGLKERIEVKVDFPTGDYETLHFFLIFFFFLNTLSSSVVRKCICYVKNEQQELYCIIFGAVQSPTPSPRPPEVIHMPLACHDDDKVKCKLCNAA